MEIGWESPVRRHWHLPRHWWHRCWLQSLSASGLHCMNLAAGASLTCSVFSVAEMLLHAHWLHHWTYQLVSQFDCQSLGSLPLVSASKWTDWHFHCWSSSSDGCPWHCLCRFLRGRLIWACSVVKTSVTTFDLNPHHHPLQHPCSPKFPCLRRSCWVVGCHWVHPNFEAVVTSLGSCLVHLSRGPPEMTAFVQIYLQNILYS